MTNHDRFARRAAPDGSATADALAPRILDRQQTGIAALDAQQRVVVWNGWIAQWTGVTPAQALHQRLDDLFPALVGGELVRALDQVAATGVPLSWSQQLDPERLDAVEAAMTPGDRQLPLFRVALAPLSIAEGSGTVLEVVEAPFAPLPNRAAPAVATEASGQLARLEDGAGIGIVTLDARGRIHATSAEFSTLTGFAADDLRGAPARLVFADLDQRAGPAALTGLRNQARGGLLRVATGAGDPRWLAAVPGTPADVADGLVLACRDVGPLLAGRDRAQLCSAQVNALMASVSDAVLLLDANGCIDGANPAALRWLDLEESAVVHRAADQLLQSPVATPLWVRAALAAGSTGELPRGTSLRRGNGELVPVAGTLTPLRDGDNKLAGGILVLRAAPVNGRESQRLAWQAEHDALTGLPNRTALAKAIAARLDRLRGSRGGSGALLYLDLANFSLVNDTCGHAAGDVLLLQVGRVLAGLIQPGDVLARAGNDEFAILLADADAAAAEALTKAVLGAFGDFTFPWGDRRLRIGVNLGCEVFDRRVESDIDVLVAAAANCNKAKELGRNRAHCPTGGAHHDGLSLWVPRISEALEGGRFRLFYQPIVALTEQREQSVRHCEVLVRMVDRNGELISPQHFIPAAERYGLIDDIDRWVVTEALRVLQRLPARQRVGLKLSLNLSGATISDESSTDFILDALERSRVDPRQLQFEITETAAIRQFDGALALIHRLRAHGCYLALDDFGSGLSSLRYLQEIPVDFLKIDGAFIRRIELSEVELAMVDTINHLAHIMGIATVAESVENATQLAMLRQLGVDYAQGFHIAMPQPLEAVLASDGWP